MAPTRSCFGYIHMHSQELSEQTRAGRVAVRSAAACGVERIVLLSSLDAEHAPANSALRLCESALRDAAVHSAVLRPTWFLDNFTTGSFASMIDSGGHRSSDASSGGRRFGRLLTPVQVGILCAFDVPGQRAACLDAPASDLRPVTFSQRIRVGLTPTIVCIVHYGPAFALALQSGDASFCTRPCARHGGAGTADPQRNPAAIPDEVRGRLELHCRTHRRGEQRMSVQDDQHGDAQRHTAGSAA
jgi:hypothetical protein